MIASGMKEGCQLVGVGRRDGGGALRVRNLGAAGVVQTGDRRSITLGRPSAQRAGEVVKE